MSPDQKYTPKYWVCHNKNGDDVYIRTAAKSLDESRMLFYELYSDKIPVVEHSNIGCSLVSLNFVPDMNPCQV